MTTRMSMMAQRDSSFPSFPSSSSVAKSPKKMPANSQRNLLLTLKKLPQIPSDDASVAETEMSCDVGSILNDPAVSVRRSNNNSTRRGSLLLQSVNQSMQRLAATSTKSLRRLSMGESSSSLANNNNNANNSLAPNSTETLWQFIDHQINDLLHKVRNQSDALIAQETELRKTLRIHVEKAKARYQAYQTGGTAMGAILSMKKFHKLQDTQANVLSAIGYLRQLEERIQGHALLAKEASQDASSSFQFAFNLNQYSQFQDEVDALVQQPHHHQDNPVTNQVLLAELASM